MGKGCARRSTKETEPPTRHHGVPGSLGDAPGGIARRLGYYPKTVSHIMRFPAFQAKVDEFQREIWAEMQASLLERVLGRRILPRTCKRHR